MKTVENSQKDNNRLLRNSTQPRTQKFVLRVKISGASSGTPSTGRYFFPLTDS
jgi:hypothetical protein